LWRQNEELPFFSVDANSKSARLLLEIVQRHLPESPADRKSAESLGRLLFRKKSGIALVLILGLLGLGLVAGGIWLLLTPGEEKILGAFFLLMGLPLCWYTILVASRVYQFHEVGVTERSVLKKKSLRYADIERMKYEATRHYHNGIYTGTSVRFNMIPANNEPPIKFSGSFRGSDDDLEHLREFISALVADKMYKRLSVQESVPWGNNASLSKKGVHFVSKPLFGSKEPRNVFFADELRYTIDNGVLSLFRSEEKKAAVRIQCSEDNFYPGFLLLGRLASEAATNP